MNNTDFENATLIKEVCPYKENGTKIEAPCT